MAGLGLAAPLAQAQEQPPSNGSPIPKSFNCYQHQVGGSSRSVQPNPNQPSIPPSSTYGSAFTPQGDLKVLVIFVGFKEDLRQGTSCWDHNTPNWPQIPSNPPPGTQPDLTFPVDFPTTCYTSTTQFSPTATDQSLSNFFYQMSRTSPNPLRMTFGTLPGRVNIDANNRGSYLNVYIPDALAEAAAAYPNFNWGAYDNRTNGPNYTYDNRISQPDGQLDYVVFCFRTSGNCASGVAAEVGIATAYGGTIPGTAYSTTDGHCQSGLGVNKSAFLHEVAHTLYDSPHEFGANGTTGNRFYQSFGWGMMQNIPTSFSANAWERWYLGWTELRTGPGQVNSDVQAPNGGQYVLRDYTTTGDVIRVHIPNSSQYLWLENRARLGPCDIRSGWERGGDGLLLLPAPTGLLAMVEDMGNRSTFLNPFDKVKTNGPRAVSAEGNFDYYSNGQLAPFGNHFWGPILNFTGPAGNASALPPNATGGHSEIIGIRRDGNQDGVINYDDFHGNGDRTIGNEGALVIAVNDVITDGVLGPHIGTRQAGFRYGLDTNPMIIPHQTYNAQQQQLSTIPLNGLSVEITGVDPATGALTLQIRFDDTRVKQNTRWTGRLQTFPVANATNGFEIVVDNGATLALDRSATPMRSTRSAAGDFENDTELRIGGGTRMAVNNGSTLRLTGRGTTLYVEDNAQLNLDGGKAELTDGTTLSVQFFSDISDLGAVLLRGGQLVERSSGQVLQRSAAPVAYPNPGKGSVVLGWPQATAAPADAAAYRYELRDLSGHALRQGTCAAGPVTLANVPAGVYLLVTTAPDGRQSTQRLEVR